MGTARAGSNDCHRGCQCLTKLGAVGEELLATKTEMKTKAEDGDGDEDEDEVTTTREKTKPLIWTKQRRGVERRRWRQGEEVTTVMSAGNDSDVGEETRW